ncbi:unnamed protein product, partial [Adineta steineri]
MVLIADINDTRCQLPFEHPCTNNTPSQTMAEGLGVFYENPCYSVGCRFFHPYCRLYWINPNALGRIDRPQCPLCICLVFNKRISWSPQYDLNILSDDCQHAFQAFAQIKNETKQEYRIDRIELIGGDIILQRENGTKRRRDRSRSRSRSLSIVSDEDEEEFDSCNMTPTIDSLGELAEQGRLVGITNLPDMAIGDKHTLTSRQDSDVSLNRQVKLISKE